MHTAHRIDELITGVKLAANFARTGGDADLAYGLELLARVGTELRDPCACPGRAHGIGCPHLGAARDLVIAALDDQGLGALATLVNVVLSDAPLTGSIADALGAVRVAMGGAA